jgi:uncharacterized phage-associated protein
VSVSAETVANRFLSLAKEEGRTLTNMQLQKLVYIAHGYHLAMVEDQEPLIYNDVQAWQFGPVFPKLYKKLRKFGAGEVKDLLPVDSAECIEKLSNAIIEGVWGAYKGKTGGQLSTLTHKAGTPWSITWAEAPFTIIPNELIASHYKSLLSGNVGGN